jgi:serine protease Do
MNRIGTGSTGLVAGILLGVLAAVASGVSAEERGGVSGFFDRLTGREDGETQVKDDREAPEPFWETESDIPEFVPQGVPRSFADLAERVSPAVVNIRTSQTVSGIPGLPPQFEEYFGLPFGGHGNPGRPHKREGAGSGFVISADGYIVTNNHVVEDMDEIVVAFKDGTEVAAKVVGRDPKTDIALIKVDSEQPLAMIALGDSDATRPGDWVVAIGNPFGLEHTVTAGIISAKHRLIGGSYDDFIQTDAAINPGNSGGPLINMKGEVIGINTAINPRANTIGFTVPINMAKQILPQLKDEGRVTRGWLGVVIQGVTPELAESFGLEDAKGALVSKVQADGPADQAGIERGDVIVTFDDTEIGEWRELPRVVAATPVDGPVDVVVIRDGKRKTIGVKIGALEEPQLARTREDEASPAAFGLRAQNITPELADQLGLDDARGVVVTEVQPGSPAEEAGLRRGDVIVEVNRKEIDDLAALREHLQAADKSVLMLIRRDDATLYVPMKRHG